MKAHWWVSRVYDIERTAVVETSAHDAATIYTADDSVLDMRKIKKKTEMLSWITAKDILAVFYLQLWRSQNHTKNITKNINQKRK